jgi:hypothetical protein
MSAIGDFFKNGLPDIIDGVGSIAGKVNDVTASIKGTKTEAVVPSEPIKNVQGPVASINSESVLSSPAIIAGGAFVAVAFLYFITKK